MGVLSNRHKRKVVSADNKIRDKRKQDLTFAVFCIKLLGKIKYPVNQFVDFMGLDSGRGDAYRAVK